MQRERTVAGFPDWEIAAGSGLWGLFGTTELVFDHDGFEWRLGVDDRSRRVIRAAREDENGRETWVSGSARSLAGALSNVPGLVRVTYGPEAGGYVEHYVARDWEGDRY